MRCGEWWVSSLDLRGSRHPCPLLPTTHLADFLSATGDRGSKKSILEVESVYWLLVDGFLVHLSSFDRFLTQSPFWSEPPRYLCPGHDIVASCFGLYLINLPVNPLSLCHRPHLNLFKILKAVSSCQ